MSWVPWDACTWGAYSKAALGCPRTPVAMAVRTDVVDVQPEPRVDLVAVPVCEEHAIGTRDWDRIEDAAGWDALKAEWPSRVWVVQREAA